MMGQYGSVSEGGSGCEPDSEAGFWSGTGFENRSQSDLSLEIGVSSVPEMIVY